MKQGKCVFLTENIQKFKFDYAFHADELSLSLLWFTLVSPLGDDILMTTNIVFRGVSKSFSLVEENSETFLAPL